MGWDADAARARLQAADDKLWADLQVLLDRTADLEASTSLQKAANAVAWEALAETARRN